MWFKKKKVVLSPLLNGKNLVCLPYSEDNMKMLGENLGLPPHYRKGPVWRLPAKIMVEIRKGCTTINKAQLIAIVNGTVKVL